MAKLVACFIALCIARIVYTVGSTEGEPMSTLLGVGTTAESQAGIASIQDGLIPEFVTLDPEILRSVVESNVTEVPPSNFSYAAGAGRWGIKGPVDKRVRWTDRNFPYSAIGRIFFAGSWRCSGALVGPRHVATAQHCIPEQGPIIFQPAYAGGDTYPSSAAQFVLKSGVPVGAPCWESSDWAIRKFLPHPKTSNSPSRGTRELMTELTLPPVILEDRIGDQRGFFGARVIEDKHLNKNVWYHMGYPCDRDGGTQPYRQSQITVASLGWSWGWSWGCPSDTRGMLVTDADATGGQSGGPLWLGPEWDTNGNLYVYGVASTKGIFDTVFSGGTAFSTWLSPLCLVRIPSTSAFCH